MNRRTVGDLKPELTRIIATSGFSNTDPRFYALLNKAVLDLIYEGDWPGVVDRYAVRINDGWITLPGDLDRLLAVSIDGCPKEIPSSWYEFVASGPGIQDNGWTDVVIPRSEICTMEKLPAADDGWDISVRGDEDERINGVRPVIIIRGYNEAGQWIRTDYAGKRIDGVAVEIDGDSVQSEVFAPFRIRDIEAILKPVTNGYVQLWASQNGGPETMIASYAPSETRPSYRQYFVPSAARAGVKQVIARARARFVPMADDNDNLLISNINALELILRALQKRASDNFDDYIKIKAMAVMALKSEASAYFGKNFQPVISMPRSLGVGGFPNLV